MKRSTAPWVIGIAAAALIALPAASGAQTTPPQQTPPQQQTPPETTPPQQTPPPETTPPQQTPPEPAQPPATPPQTTPPATQQTTPAEQQHEAHHSPADHLQQAKAALNGIEASSVTGTAKTKLAQVKRHIAALERSAGANDKASATGQAARSPRATASRGNANWATEVAAIDKLLNEMLGATGTPATTDPAATTGTTGTTGTTRGSRAASAVTIDDATRAKLTEVRTHITAFAASMSGTASSPAAGTDAAKASQPPATTGAATEPPTSATATRPDPASPTTPEPPTTAPQTTPPATTTQPPATGTTGTATGTTTGTATAGTTASDTATASAAGSAKVDPEAAKRHLTEARDTLSQLTQLPEAAQLTGDARDQVSQIITNFNELITTQAEWRAIYGKLQANLVALLGAETTDEANVPPPATATPGAVGTSGTATLDPKVRQKLVEFRSKLAEFERAAGGVKQ